MKYLALLILFSCSSLPKTEKVMSALFDNNNQAVEERVETYNADKYVKVHVYPHFAGGNRYIESAQIIVPFKTPKKRLQDVGEGARL